MKVQSKKEVQPVIARLEEFDEKSGLLPERILFNNRMIVVLACIAVTIALGYYISKLRLNANFEKTIPIHHPFIVNYLQHKIDLAGLGNAVRLAVENTEGTIYNAKYLDVLQKVTDEAFLLPGVDRMNLRSLCRPARAGMKSPKSGSRAAR